VAAIVACLLAVRSGVRAQEAAGDGKWIQLFNGKDLKDWTVKITGHEAGENYKDTFRVEDGVLKVSYDGYEKFGGKFGHIFYRRPFSSYRLRVEYRFVGEQVDGGPSWAYRNSGIMIHGQSPESMTKAQEFPASIEVQLLGGRDTGERSTANLCTPGTNVVMDGKLITQHCTNSSSKTYRGDEWVTAEVEVLGSSVTHVVNGEPVMSYTDPQLDPRDRDAQRLLEAGAEKMLLGGTISLQSESHPVEFRKVEILELAAGDETASPSGWVDLLAGGDLSRCWETTGNWKLDKDGAVTLTPRPGEQGWSRWDAYLWLKGSYQDFEIAFDYRVEKSGNSGFYFHVGDRNSPVDTGIEVQIYESHAKGKDARLTDHDSGGIIPRIPPAKNAAKPAGEWNRFRIISKGNDVTVELNGEIVNEVKLDDPRIAGRPRAGAIGFQDHALPLALRNVRIRRL
jgi:hypothetical protein